MCGKTEKAKGSLGNKYLWGDASGPESCQALKPITTGANAENLQSQVFLTCTVNSRSAWITQKDAVFKNTKTTDKMVHTYYSSPWEVEAGGLGIRCHPQLGIKFKARYQDGIQLPLQAPPLNSAVQGQTP